MPLIPNTLENLLFMQFNLAPAPMLDIFSSLASRIVFGALELDLFEALEKKSQSAAELAQTLKAHPEGMRLMLETLVSLKYVQKDGEKYANSRMTSKWLVSTAEINLAPYVKFWGKVLPVFYNNVDESIRTGKAPLNLYEWIETQPEASDYFQKGMIALAKFGIKEMAGMLKLPATAKTLLDVGGGHGMYSLAYCRANPQLTATIFDSPQALNTAKEHIAAEKMEARIRLQTGNFITDDLGSGYDAALVVNIIHGFSPEQNLDLLGKVARALNKGGQVILIEQLAGKAPLPLANAINNILGLNYFHLLNGRIYRYEEVATMLKQTGFSKIEHKVMRQAGSSVLIGTKG